MSERKFYKNVITLEILSQEPIPEGMELGNIINECMEGGYSMRTTEHTETELSGKEAADALLDQGSDPGFFRLNPDGEDAEL